MVMESSLRLRWCRLSLPELPRFRMFCPTLERLRKLGCCAKTFEQKNKKVKSKRYVDFIDSVTNLKSQFPPNKCFGQIPNHKEIKNKPEIRNSKFKSHFGFGFSKWQRPFP